MFILTTVYYNDINNYVYETRNECLEKLVEEMNDWIWDHAVGYKIPVEYRDNQNLMCEDTFTATFRKNQYDPDRDKYVFCRIDDRYKYDENVIRICWDYVFNDVTYTYKIQEL